MSTIQDKIENTIAKYKLEEIDLTEATKKLKKLFKLEIEASWNTAIETNNHTESWLKLNKRITSLEEYLKLKEL